MLSGSAATIQRLWLYETVNYFFSLIGRRLMVSRAFWRYWTKYFDEAHGRNKRSIKSDESSSLVCHLTWYRHQRKLARWWINGRCCHLPLHQTEREPFIPLREETWLKGQKTQAVASNGQTVRAPRTERMSSPNPPVLFSLGF